MGRNLHVKNMGYIGAIKIWGPHSALLNCIAADVLGCVSGEKKKWFLTIECKINFLI